MTSPPATDALHSVPAAASLRRRVPALVYLLASGTFLMGTSEFLVAGLLPQVARDYHVGVAEAGLSITTFAVGMVLGAPTIVLLTLRRSRRFMLTAALVVFAFGHVAVALSSVFPLMLGARFVTALATSAFWGIASLVAADVAGAGLRARALSITISGATLANVAGVPLGSLIGQHAGWRVPFWLLAAVALLVAIAINRLVPGSPPDHQPPTLRRELGALRSGRMWLALATCACVTGGVLSIYSYVAPLITERAHLSQSVVPLALVMFGVVAVCGTLIAGRVGDRYPHTATIVGASVTLTTVILLGIFSSIPVAMLALFAFLGLTGLALNPILVSLAQRYGSSGPTLASALTPSCFNFGTALGTGITAAALGVVGPIAPVLIGAAGGALVLAGTIALAVIAKRPSA